MPPLPTSALPETAVESPVSAVDPKSDGATGHAPAWQTEWGNSFRTARELLTYLELDPSVPQATLTHGLEFNLNRDVDHTPTFPLRVPRPFAALMRKGDWNDPLLLQVLSRASERLEASGFTSDAVGDGDAQDGPGVLRKYKGRALLVVTGECAVHCRYCFRREYPYSDQTMNRDEWDSVYARLNEDPTVEEILFSGGDPLSLSDAKLERHLRGALSLTRVRRVRIHTRLPVVLPARVDAGFLSLIREVAAQKPLHIVLHINHVNEISPALIEKAHALRAAGAILLNQSVLLRGVNDSVQALEDLSLRLLDAGILPYYLHQLDRVRGAHHFEVPEDEGLKLMDELRTRVPGYGLPRYVREVAGEKSKTEVRN